MGGLVTTPEEAIAIAEAWLEQEHRRPPGTQLNEKKNLQLKLLSVKNTYH